MDAARKKIVGLSVFCVAVLVYVGSLTWLNIRDFENTLVDQTQNHLFTIAQAQVRNVEAVISDVQQDLDMLAINPLVQEAIVFGQCRFEDCREKQCACKVVYNHFKDIVSCLYKLDVDGIVQGAMPYNSELIGMDYSDKKDIKDAKIRQTSLISEVFEDEDGQKAISICCPVYEKEKLIGFLRAVISLQALNNLISRTEIGGSSGFPWVLSEDGTIVSHPNIEFVGEHISKGIELCSEEFRPQAWKITKSMLAGKSGVTVYYIHDWKSPDDKMCKKLGAFLPVSLSNRTWSLMVCLDSEYIAGPIRGHTRNTLVIVACLMLTIVLGIVFYYKAEKKKSQLETYMAVDRVNRELQYISAERDETTGELQEKLELLQSVLSAVPYSIYWKDVNCIYQGCNSEFARFLGLDRPQDIVGKTDYDLPRKKSRADFLAKCDKEIIKAGVPLLNVEQNWETNDGHVEFLMNKIPLRDARGKITGILGINIDVAKLTAEAYISKRDMKLLNKTFLSVVDGAVIIDTSNKVVRYNRVFAEIFNKTQENLTGKSLFTLTQGQAGKGIRETIGIYKKNSNTQVKSLLYKIAERYFQVTIHCIYKADKYDGALLSFVDVSDLKNKIIQLQEYNCNIRNLIRDTSHKIRTPLSNVIGFAEILRESKLDPKFAGYTERIHASGTEIMRVLNDMIDETPEKDFQSSANRQKLQDKSQISDSQNENINCSRNTEQIMEPQNTQQTGKILVVDDIPENRMLVDVILKKAGYDVAQSANGEEAVQICSEKSFDLILMDIQMPVMGGQEAARKIKEQGLNTKTSILAMTASLDSDQESVISDENFDDYLSKPLKKESLLRKIWRYMEQSKQLAAADSDEDIVSFLGDNPDYRKTIEMFVKNLPGRIKEMQDALNRGDIEELTRKVHALKGLGGFAGFAIYTEKAKELEQTIRSEHFENIQKQLEEMTRLCLRTKLTKKES